MKTIYISIAKEPEDMSFNTSNFLIVSSFSELKDYLNERNIHLEDCDYIIKSIEDGAESNAKEILSNLDEVVIDLSKEYDSIRHALNYLDKHDYLKKYRFVLSSKDYRSINYEELLEMNQYITKITKYVNHFQMSPLEQTIFVSDLVKELKYKESDENNLSVSRDLIEVIHQDYIVCLGYSNLFKAILDQLNIPTSIIFYENETNYGHAANRVYLKDEKYGIDGSFAYDLTWGPNDNTSTLLDNYNYIAIPIELDYKVKYLRDGYTVKTDEKKEFECSIKKYISPEDSSLEQLPEFIHKMYYEGLLKKANKFSKSYKVLSFEDYAEEKKIELDQMKSFDKIQYVYDYYNQYIKNAYIEIPNDDFMKALYSAKRIEMSLRSEKIFLLSDLSAIMEKRIQFLESIKKAKKKNDIVLDLSKLDQFLASAGLSQNAEMYEETKEELEQELEEYYKKPSDGYEHPYLEKDQAVMDLLASLRKLANQDTENPVKSGRKI